MKKHLVSLFIALTALFAANLSAQAASASDISNDSIVTIQYTTSHHTYYLAATSTSQVGVVTDNPTNACLWKYSVNGNNITLQNVSNNNYLRAVGSEKSKKSGGKTTYYGSFSFSLSSTASSGSSFVLYNVNGTTTSQQDVYIDQASLKTSYKGDHGTYDGYITCTESKKSGNYSGSFSISTSESNVLRIQEWSRKSGAPSLEMSMSPNTAEFGLMASDVTTTVDPKTVTLTIKYTQKNYYVNKSNAKKTIDIETTTKTKPNDLQALGITPTIAWKNASGATTGTTTQMTYGTLTKNTNNWTVKITPSGESPMGDISLGVGNLPDFADTLVATAMIDDQPYTAQTVGNCNAFLIENFNGLETYFEPAQVIFEPDQNLTKTMEIKMGFKVSKTYYWAINGRKEVEIIQEQSDIDLTQASERAKVTYTITPLQDAVGEAPDWLTASPSGSVVTGLPSNLITLTADPNTALVGRSARMHADFKYVDGATTYTSSLCQGSVTQLSNATAAAIQFQSYHGVGDQTLDAQGRQRVHENKKTIYYTSGESVQLTIPENQFQGWVRWYDYNTGRNPIYNSPDASFAWTTEPQVGTRTYLTDINTGKFSMGLYASNNGSNKPNNPVFKAWTDDQMHQIACDLSNYKDYSVNVTNGSGTIKEPTLSYRVLYTFLPAEEMADSLAKCTGNNFYETHQYVVPGGKDVLLETNYRFSKTFSHASELCYWYWDGSTLKNVGGSGASATWYKNGSSSNTDISDGGVADFAQINIAAGRVDTFDLKFKVGSTTYNIARFIVTAQRQKDQCGPSKTPLITPETIAEEYVDMAYIDFNFTADDPVPNGQPWNYAPVHMPWSDGSYGYTYHEGYPVVAPATSVPTTSQAGNQGYISYGEYSLLDSINFSWGATGGAYGGHGYCLYADGMQAPGMAASISADTKICSGQLMYCSAWLRNPGKNNTKPVFRFNVQGSNDNEKWEDIGAFMVGEMEYQSGWQQVVFPLVSAHDYAHVRVSLYNFGKGTTGNDFMVDEIRLFAGKLPLSSYQATSSCLSSTAITSVIRLDFNELDSVWSNKPMFYDIYNATDDTTMIPVDGYYGSHTAYGEFMVPAHGYDPTLTEDSLVYDNITAFVDAIKSEYDEENYSRNKRGYALETVQGKERWVMYLVHLLDNMDSRNTYQIRMVSDIKDIHDPKCVLTTILPIAKETGAKINGETAPELNGKLCANNLVSIDMEVSNENATGATQKGACRADWLFAYPSDSIFLPDQHPTEAQIANADSLFRVRYHYTRNEVKDALSALRRAYYGEDGEIVDSLNPNRLVFNTNLLKKEGFRSNEKNYHIILCLADTLNLLQLGVEKQDFYMMANQQLYYWIFPIKGTGFTKDSVELEVCDNSMIVGFTTGESQYILNLSTKDLDDLTPEQRLQVPGVRVSAKDANEGFIAPVSNIANCVIGFDSTQLVSTNDPVINGKLDKGQTVSIRYWQDRIYQDASAAAYYQNGQTIFFKPVDADRVEYLQQRYIDDNAANPGIWTEGHPGWQHANTDLLRPGYEYLFKTTMMTTTFQAKANNDFCPVGETFFRMIVVPDTMLWSPKGNEYNNWSDDDNWRGIVNGDTLDHGYVPMPHTVVIIPELADEALYPYITADTLSIDAHYSPVVCKNIVFSGNTKMLNQSQLQYEKAFAELSLPAATWTAVSAPLKDVYSGDMYIPLTENDDPCIANKLDYTRGAEEGYHFWASYYNQTVHQYDFYGNENNRNGKAHTWSRSNSAETPVLPGKGFGLLGFGPDYADDVDLTIRLPKQDKSYTYVNDGGEEVDTLTTATLTRTNANKLALDLDAEGKQVFTLQNNVSDTKFLFGNPSMAYIDMYKFLSDNGLKATFYYNEDENWIGTTPTTTTTTPDRYLAPMRAVIIEAQTAATTLNVTLKRDHMTLRTQLDKGTDPTDEGHGDAPLAAPRRVDGVRTGYLRSDVMNIYAFNDDADALTRLCINNFADNAYIEDEDAPFIYSMNVDDAALSTPMNIYTVCGDMALSADARESITRVPLAFLIDDDYRTVDMKLYFDVSMDWPQNVWLYDAQTDVYSPIYNGIVYEIETPANHEIRYYIVGASEDNPTVPTALDEQPEEEDIAAATGSDWKLYVYNMHQSHATLFCDYPMTDIVAYDLAGRVIAHIAPNSTSATLQLPHGVALFEVTTPAGKRVVRTIIK